MQRSTWKALAGLVVLTACAGSESPRTIQWTGPENTIQIGDPTMAHPVIGGQTALYLLIRNGGMEVDTLLGFDLAGFGRVSMHRTTMEGDISSMTSVESVVVAPGEVLSMVPGGLHGMVEGLPGGLVLGEPVFVRVQFAMAGWVTAHAIVRDYDEVDEVFGGA